MKAVLATVVSVLTALAVVVVFVQREQKNDHLFASTYDGADLSIAAYGSSGQSCCSAFNAFKLLEDGDKYNVNEVLSTCNVDEKAKNCRKACSKMWTSQGCKACCDFKDALGIFDLPDTTTKRACKQRCRTNYACSFDGGPTVVNPTCSQGSCNENFKCTKAAGGYCQCTRDITTWLTGREVQ